MRNMKLQHRIAKGIIGVIWKHLIHRTVRTMTLVLATLTEDDTKYGARVETWLAYFSI